MRMLQKGDKCPMCGRPIKTDDPNKLIVISAFGWIREQADAGKWHPENSVCEDGSTGATNADKLRSLPDEEIVPLLNTCLAEYGAEPCLEIKGSKAVSSCRKCFWEWLKAPYTGWNNEKKS